MYVPGFNPEAFTETLTDAGIVEPLAEALSHEPPVVVAAATVKLAPAVPCTLTDCAGGWLPPTAYVNVSGVVETVSADEARFSDTGMFRGLLPTPAAVIWMLPVSVPDPVIALVLMETVKFAGVVPELGETVSHAPEVTVAVTAVALAGDVLMLSVCAAGAVPPSA